MMVNCLMPRAEWPWQMVGGGGVHVGLVEWWGNTNTMEVQGGQRSLQLLLPISLLIMLAMDEMAVFHFIFILGTDVQCCNSADTFCEETGK